MVTLGLAANKTALKAVSVWPQPSNLSLKQPVLVNNSFLIMQIEFKG